MKSMKLIILASFVVAASAALFTAGASATVLCKVNKIPCPSPEDYEFGTNIEATLETGTSLVFRDTAGNVHNTCTKSTIDGITENTGVAGAPIKVKVTKATFEGCTYTTVVTTLGRYHIDYAGGTKNTVATLTLTETEVKVMTPFGNCVYEAGTETDIGTLTGGFTATVDVEAVLFREEEGGVFCPGHDVWEAKYTVTAPKPLFIKEEMK